MPQSTADAWPKATGLLAWTPGIGDPSPMAWATVALYFASAWACLRTARSKSIAPREATFWFVLALLLAGLGINKQLDLQTALTELGRWVAHSRGWYDRRREVQLVFGALVVLLALGFGALTSWLLWRSGRPTKVAILGCGLLTSFVVLRALSFHHFDEFIGWDLLGIRMSWLLEIGGISIVASGALLEWRRISAAPLLPK
jgi:hypothetical protein